MQLTLWTYEGPPHVGAMRIAASMRDVHLVLHAPQGDTYADLLFTMIQREDRRPPVSYTTFQARDLGGDTATLAKDAVADAWDRFRPSLMLVGESCTAELIQDHPGTLGASLGLPVPVVPLELPAYSKKEHWGASETLYRLVRTVLAARTHAPHGANGRLGRPTANILGPTLLGFRCRDDVVEVEHLLGQLGIGVNAVAPLGATVEDIARLPDADFNIDLYPEVSATTARWLERTFGQPSTRTVPMGVGATREFIAEVAALAGVDPAPALAGEHPGEAARAASRSRLPWYTRSVDSTYLTGKRVFVFADATHAIAAARVARDEMGFEVVGLGSYSRERAREVRAAAADHGLEALITDDYLEVERAIRDASPELVLGTQMERHVAKRLGIGAAVISSPIHVQDVPARHSPVFGFEGANVLFDTWVHPLTMGLEEHLLAMFRDDFEFNDESAASHLPVGAGGARGTPPAVAGESHVAGDLSTGGHPQFLPADAGGPAVRWSPDGERELQKIPFFVRSKARRNTERFARERNVGEITVEVLYEAKSHFSR